MARTMLRDVRGGRRRDSARFIAAACCVLLMSAVLPGCDLTTPSEPNSTGSLTGQTTNQQFVFTGTIGLTSFTATISADDTSTVTITATVNDPSGNPITNLTPVQFSTDLGGFVTGTNPSTGALITSPGATVNTFNGVAQTTFVSVGRASGTASIVAGVGSTTATTNVVLEAIPISGTLTAAFGTGGTGAPTMTGSASAAAPLDVDISARVVDDAAMAIIGATVKFVIQTDTTDETTTNEPVKFVGNSTSLTNVSGVAISRIRVQGPGDVIIIAQFLDPDTGAVIAESNQIVLVTAAAGGGPSIVLTFSDGSSRQFSFSGATATLFTEGIQATVLDTDGTSPLGGVSVRFSIVSDTTGGGTFSNGTTGPITTTTNGSGIAFNSITVTTAGQIVTMRAELLDATGAVIATSNDIVALFD